MWARTSWPGSVNRTKVSRPREERDLREYVLPEPVAPISITRRGEIMEVCDVMGVLFVPVVSKGFF